MATSVSLGELMSSDFVVVGDGDDDSIRHELGPAGQPVAVVVDPGGRVSGVWSAEGRGTPIITAADTPAEDIATSASLLTELTRTGGAIVVLSGSRPVGVIPAQRFAEYLAGERGLRVTTLGETAAGDSLLAGGYQQSLLVIVCGTCGWRNELRSWVEGVTRCANPAPPAHLLTRVS
jgi:hypothetical protein